LQVKLAENPNLQETVFRVPASAGFSRKGLVIESFRLKPVL
jgi:hypothetical protein